MMHLCVNYYVQSGFVAAVNPKGKVKSIANTGPTALNILPYMVAQAGNRPTDTEYPTSCV
ncbi:hypothetical protein FJD36_02700 [Pseudomonas chlororaphis subsp. chlororaphis]|nr:hypothetical protein FJD36_02700 [Pseudomonas chlororaphis subsp. chlororaphis]